MAGEWWPCSGAICGRGSQERLVQCVILEANGRERMIDNVLCNTTIRPNDTRQCVVKDTSQCDTQWDVEEWGQVRVYNNVNTVKPPIMDTPIRGQPPYNGQTACPLPLTVHTFLPPTKGQPPNNGQNACPHHVHYSEVPL